MRHRIDIRGRITPNDYKEVMEFFGLECTCPCDVQRVIDTAAGEDAIDVYINSGGGEIFAGSEIYTALRQAAQDREVCIYVTGDAASAASVIACAAHSYISPTAQMMVHCVSTYAEGNHNEMEKAAEELRTADRALCRAYMDKAGLSEEEALSLMENETWLTAEDAVKLGLIDEIMFDQEGKRPMVASTCDYLSASTLQRMQRDMEAAMAAGRTAAQSHQEAGQEPAGSGKSEGQAALTAPGYHEALERTKELEALRRPRPMQA